MLLEILPPPQYYWRDYMKRGELGDICSTKKEIRNVYKILVTKAMGKLVLGDQAQLRR
jgi:hypothetical protein